MAVTTSNLLQGPCDVYVGLTSAADPTSPTATISSTDYTNLGATSGGTTLSFSTTYSPLMVDQITIAAESVATEVAASIQTTLAETTLENLKIVLNGGTITTATNTKTFKPLVSTVGQAPAYAKVLLVSKAPNGKKRLVIARKCLSTEGTETAFSKDDMSVYSVTFTLHYVSDSVSAIDWLDDVSA